MAWSGLTATTEAGATVADMGITLYGARREPATQATAVANAKVSSAITAMTLKTRRKRLESRGRCQGGGASAKLATGADNPDTGGGVWSEVGACQ